MNDLNTAISSVYITFMAHSLIIEVVLAEPAHAYGSTNIFKIPVQKNKISTNTFTDDELNLNISPYLTILVFHIAMHWYIYIYIYTYIYIYIAPGT